MICLLRCAATASVVVPEAPVAAAKTTQFSL